jgi:hypothetical protein
MTMTELSDDVRALFDGPNYAHVATVLPDGGPHSVPVWVGLEGNRIAFLTSGQPYPLRTDRVVFLIDPEQTLARAYG